MQNPTASKSIESGVVSWAVAIGRRPTCPIRGITDSGPPLRLAWRKKDSRSAEISLYAAPCELHACSCALQSPTVLPETFPELTASAQALFWIAHARWIAAPSLTKVLPLTEKGLSGLPESVTAGAEMAPMASPLEEEEEEEEAEPLLALPSDSFADAVELLPSAAACWELPFCPFSPLLALPAEDEEPGVLEGAVADEGVAPACSEALESVLELDEES